jgi:hypothetical protein
MEDQLRSKIHKALGVDPPSAALADRILASLAVPQKSRRPFIRQEILSTVGVLAVVAVLGGLFGAMISARSNARTPAPAATPRVLPACTPAQVGLSVIVERRLGTRFSFIRLDATDRGTPCFLDASVAVALIGSAGRPLQIDGNGSTIVLEGTLPREQVLAGFSWVTWCGRDQSYIVAVDGDLGHRTFSFSGSTPPCPDAPAERGVPSILAPASVLSQPSSSAAQRGIAYEFPLSAQCGLQVVDFSRSFWDVSPGQGIPAINLRGTMTLIDDGHARFDFTGGAIFFQRHSGSLLVDTHSQLCD